MDGLSKLIGPYEMQRVGYFTQSLLHGKTSWV